VVALVVPVLVGGIWFVTRLSGPSTNPIAAVVPNESSDGEIQLQSGDNQPETSGPGGFSSSSTSGRGSSTSGRGPSTSDRGGLWPRAGGGVSGAGKVGVWTGTGTKTGTGVAAIPSETFSGQVIGTTSPGENSGAYDTLRPTSSGAERTPPVSPVTRGSSSKGSPPVASSTPPVTSSTPPVTSSTPPVTSSTPPVTSSTPPVTSSTPPVTSSTPPVTSSTPPE
jgi:hypothetical protein